MKKRCENLLMRFLVINKIITIIVSYIINIIDFIQSKKTINEINKHADFTNNRYIFSVLFCCFVIINFFFIIIVKDIVEVEEQK